MANRFRVGQERIAQALKAHGSDTVTYRRGGDSVALAASPGRPDMAFGPEFGGTILRGDRREWIITAADLVLDGETVKPQIGDVIDISEAGQTLRFLVAPDGQLQEFELADAFGLMLRIRGAYQKVVI